MSQKWSISVYIKEKLLSKVWHCFHNTIWSSVVACKVSLKHFKILFIYTEKNIRAIGKHYFFCGKEKYWRKIIAVCRILAMFYQISNQHKNILARRLRIFPQQWNSPCRKQTNKQKSRRTRYELNTLLCFIVLVYCGKF